MLEYCSYAVIIQSVLQVLEKISFFHSITKGRPPFHNHIYISIFTRIHYRTGTADPQCFKHFSVDRKPQ